MIEYLAKTVQAYQRGGISEVCRGGYRKAIRPVFEKTPLYVPYSVRKSRARKNELIDELIDRGVGRRFDREELLDRKSSETVFILGSGGSIAEISEREWDLIDSHDSIGLNRWPIHDFVPTYYVLELPFDPSMRRDMIELINFKRTKYESVPIIIKDIERSEEYIKSDSLPDWLKQKVVLSPESNFPEMRWTTQQQARLLRYLVRNGAFDPEREHDILYRKRGSISYLLHLACILGYENIVLCGVDMVNSVYFFDVDREYYESKEFPIPEKNDRQQDETHNTNDPRVDDLTLEDVIYLLDKIVLKPRSINLYVENSISALHPNIPLYEYSDSGNTR